MGYILGRKCKLFVQDSGAWREVTSVKTVTVNENDVTADATTRGSGQYRQQVPVLKELSVDIEMQRDPNDPWQKKLLDAAQQQTVVTLAVAEGDITTQGSGVEYLEFDAYVFNRSDNEPLEDLKQVTLQAVPAPGSAPQRKVA